ncbi:ATP-binding protein [Pseudanabaena sp. FACHB-1998]|nr:ATP-binding protein [Pseudanabaena sp. FACHB-1998]
MSRLVKRKAIPLWQAVIKQWQTIIQQELEQLQRQSQGEILNPFQYGNPLTRDRAQLFKGRSAFADQIVRQILDRNRPTIILHGPRRCGKSSFLLNLPHLLTSDVLPVYIDLQSQSASQSEADFWFTIVRAIHRDARSQQVLLPTPPKREEFRLSPYPQLEDWLDTALTQLGDRRILLNIDEFEAIGTAMEQGRISTNLFDELRSLIQHWDRLSFLFSGVQTLHELGTNWSSYFISAMPIEMTYLNPNEAKELLLNPDPEFTLEYDTGIVDQILTLTRCHPYLLQLLGWVLVQLANTTHTQIVTPTLLQSAIPEAYINGIGYFTNVWEQFTGTSPTEVTAGQQQLLALAQGQHPHPTDEAAEKSLLRMLRYHIIEKIDNQYKFEVPLIERWVREKSN